MFCAHEACSAFTSEMTVETLRGYKSPGTDQIAVELIQLGDKTVHSVVHKLVWAVEGITIYTYLNQGWQKMVVSNEAHHCYQLHAKFYPTFFC